MSEKWMEKNDVQDFKSRAEFEKQEGPITAHSRYLDKMMFWTKDGTFTMPIDQWEIFNKLQEARDD